MRDTVTLTALHQALHVSKSRIQSLIEDGHFEPSRPVNKGQTRGFDLHDVARLTTILAIIDAGHSAKVGRGLSNLKGSIEGERWIVVTENMSNLRGVGGDLGHPYTIAFAKDETLLQAVRDAVGGAHPLTLVLDFDEILRTAEETFQRALTRRDEIAD